MAAVIYEAGDDRQRVAVTCPAAAVLVEFVPGADLEDVHGDGAFGYYLAEPGATVEWVVQPRGRLAAFDPRALARAAALDAEQTGDHETLRAFGVDPDPDTPGVAEVFGEPADLEAPEVAELAARGPGG